MKKKGHAVVEGVHLVGAAPGVTRNTVEYIKGMKPDDLVPTR
jgi:metal-dependent hydrolase (beta-lactamase superfamily II)